MYYSDLLDRMKKNDTEAFLEMTDQYGWAVYSAIREKYMDQDVADKVYNETMNAFYRILADSDAEDPLEALLFGFANQISPDNLLYGQTLLMDENGIPEIQLRQRESTSTYTKTSVRKGKDNWHYYMVLLLIVFAASLWIIVGFLMKMEWIPFCDLGYFWFDFNVVQPLMEYFH